MSINHVRAVGDDRPWKDEVERDLQKLWDAIKYGKLSIKLSSTTGTTGGGSGADAITATLPATYDSSNLIVGVDQDSFDRIGSLNYAQFDITPTGVPVGEGVLSWNTVDKTLDLQSDGITYQLGQELAQNVKRFDSSGLADGKVVYVTGSDGANILVDYAIATSDITSATTFGVMTASASGGAKAPATTFGLVRNIDTSALTEGETVWLSGSVAGGMTTTKPVAPVHGVQIGFCIRSHAVEGAVFVAVQNGYELNELHDVAITSVAADNILVRNAGNTLWENKPQSVLTIAESQVTNLVSDLAAKAPTASPTFTGTVTTPLTTAGYVTTTSGGVLGSVATIPNAGLTNSSVTVNGSSVSLGGSVTVTAEPTGTAGGKLSGTYPNPGLNASIDDLNDVTITTPSSGQALTYNGSAWVNTTPAAGGTVTSVAAGTGLSASPSPITTSGTISLADTAVTAASYGSATQVGAFTVDAQGRLTAASNTSIQIAESQVTNLVTDLAGKAGLTTANGFTGVNTFTKQGTANSPSIRTESASWATSPKVGLVTNSGSNTGSSTNNIALESRADSTAARYHFSFSNGNGVVGSINTSGTATAYTTSSDYRLKENVTPMVGAAERVMQLKPSRFTFINDSAKFVDGFIAHELGEVIPEAVFGEKDAINEDGTPNYQGVDQSKVVPLLTAALQDALKKIAELTDRIEALEN